MLRTGTRVRAPALSTRSIALSAIRTSEGGRTWRIGASGLIGHWDLVIGNSRVVLLPLRPHASEYRQRRPSFLVLGSWFLVPPSSVLSPQSSVLSPQSSFLLPRSSPQVSPGQRQLHDIGRVHAFLGPACGPRQESLTVSPRLALPSSCLCTADAGAGLERCPTPCPPHQGSLCRVFPSCRFRA